MTEPSLNDTADHHLDDQVLDEEWLAAPTKRSRGRLILIGLLAAAVCFLGGAFTQKHYGPSTTAATAAPGGTAGLPGGFPGGGQGFPGGAGGFPGAGTQSDQQGAAGGGDQPTGTEAVIGHVVQINGNTWTVEDLGGKRHQITITDDTLVTREETLTADQVAQGDTVSITGTTSGDKVSADQITLR